MTARLTRTVPLLLAGAVIVLVLRALADTPWAATEPPSGSLAYRVPVGAAATFTLAARPEVEMRVTRCGRSLSNGSRPSNRSPQQLTSTTILKHGSSMTISSCPMQETSSF